MTLHRDIFWLGRQWAVTGYGVQACDQKQKGRFDVEAGRLWDDEVLENLRAQKWFNAEDFDQALSIARKRFPEPPKSVPATPPKETASAKELMPPATNGIVVPPLPEFGAAKSAAVEPLRKAVEAVKPEPVRAEPLEPTGRAAASFQLRIAGSAKFAIPWRLRLKR